MQFTSQHLQPESLDGRQKQFTLHRGQSASPSALDVKHWHPHEVSWTAVPWRSFASLSAGLAARLQPTTHRLSWFISCLRQIAGSGDGASVSVRSSDLSQHAAKIKPEAAANRVWKRMAPTVKQALRGLMAPSETLKGQGWKPSRRSLASGSPPADASGAGISQLPISFLPATGSAPASPSAIATPPAAAAPAPQVSNVQHTGRRSHGKRAFRHYLLLG